MESANLTILASPGSFCHVLSITSLQSPGLLLARYWAQSPSLFSSLFVPFSSNNFKQITRSHVLNMWNDEWASSQILPCQTDRCIVAPGLVTGLSTPVQSGPISIKISKSYFNSFLILPHVQTCFNHLGCRTLDNTQLYSKSTHLKKNVMYHKLKEMPYIYYLYHLYYIL